MTTHFYVATSGNDTTGTGVYGAPWATLAKAAVNVVPDCIVHVAPGTYTLTSGLTTSTSGTASQRIAYQSDVLGGALLRGSGVATVWTQSGSYVDIVGFDISGDATCTNAITNSGSNCSVRYCLVHDLTNTAAIGIWHSSTTATSNDTIGCRISNMASTGSTGHGIRHSHPNGHIWNNLIWSCKANGIYLWDSANTVTIANNTCFANGTGIFVGGSGATNSGCVVANNISYSNSQWGIKESGTTGTNSYLNNALKLNGTAGYALQNGNAGTGTVTADPKFVNYQANGSGDYHLQSSSPCLSAGTATGAPTSDLEQRIRPIGSSYDIGAYEFYQAPALTLMSDNPYGTTIGVSNNQNTSAWLFPAAFYADVLDLGISWIRGQCPWSQIETTQTNPQTFGPTPVFDDFVLQCNTHGIRCYITIKLPPTWWQTQYGGIMDPMSTATFALYLLNRYNGRTINPSTGNPYGKIQLLELGNEDFDLTYSASQYAMQLSNVLSTVVPLAKAAYPDVLIGNAAQLESRKSKKHLQNWLNTLFSNTPAAVINNLAFLNFHAYFGKTANGTACNDPYTEIPSGGDTNVNWPDYFAAINAVQQSYGYTLPIWCTETGWITDLNFNHDPTLIVSENTRWTYLQYQLDQARTSGGVVTHVFIYKIDEGTPNNPHASDGYSPVQIERTPKQTYSYTQLKSYIAAHQSWTTPPVSAATLFPAVTRREGGMPGTKRREGQFPATQRRG